MFYRLLLVFFICCMRFSVGAEDEVLTKKHYPLSDNPIDVVIVTHPKDKATLDLCIDGVLANCINVRRVIVVSSEKLSDKAEWFDEKNYPFSKSDVAKALGRGNKEKIEARLGNSSHGIGWYYQQLLKCYSLLVIPGIAENVLVIDSDTVLMKPIKFTNDQGGPLFCISHFKEKPVYFKHAKRLVPGYKRVNPENYSIAHHMLFQKPIMIDLMETVERYHQKPFWVAFCYCVDFKNSWGGASEYECYSNFVLRTTNLGSWRELKWKNSGRLENIENYRQAGYDFVSFHSYMRKDTKCFYGEEK